MMEWKRHVNLQGKGVEEREDIEIAETALPFRAGPSDYAGRGLLISTKWPSGSRKCAVRMPHKGLSVGSVTS